MTDQERQDWHAFFEDAFSNATEVLDETSSKHPSHTLLTAYVYDQLDTAEAARLSVHITRCGACHREVAQLRAELGSVEREFEAVTASESPFSARSPIQIDHKHERTIGSSVRNRLLRWQQELAERLQNRRAWVGHAAAFAAASIAALLLNWQALQAPQTTSPYTSTQGASGVWWAPWVVGLWALVVIVHGIVVWRKRHRS